MYKYTVTFYPDTENGLCLLDLGEDGYSEPVDIDDQGGEIYHVFTQCDIERELDTRAQIAHYTVEETAEEVAD